MYLQKENGDAHGNNASESHILDTPYVLCYFKKRVFSSYITMTRDFIENLHDTPVAILFKNFNFLLVSGWHCAL